jgi:YgiT-type zinc finger domain-containing protein
MIIRKERAMAKIDYKICPRCNYITQADVPGRFCTQCGEKLLKYCKQCRATISNPFALHCPSCGNPYHLALTGTAAEASPAVAGIPSSFRIAVK